LEVCLEAHPHLQQFAKWRAQAVEGSFAYKRMLKKVKTLEMKSIVESSLLGAKADQPKAL
jgi:hypothetical protein